jgi:hypothetical protein
MEFQNKLEPTVLFDILSYLCQDNRTPHSKMECLVTLVYAQKNNNEGEVTAASSVMGWYVNTYLHHGHHQQRDKDLAHKQLVL